MKSVKLKLHIGRTINLGNYESLRVDVGIEEDAQSDLKWWVDAEKSLNEKLETIIKTQLKRDDESFDEGVEEFTKDIGKITKPAERRVADG